MRPERSFDAASDARAARHRHCRRPFAASFSGRVALPVSAPFARYDRSPFAAQAAFSARRDARPTAGPARSACLHRGRSCHDARRRFDQSSARSSAPMQFTTNVSPSRSRASIVPLSSAHARRSTCNRRRPPCRRDLPLGLTSRCACSVRSKSRLRGPSPPVREAPIDRPHARAPARVRSSQRSRTQSRS